MSHSQFHSTNLFILRHAWLNLWDKHMTTGRINQVTISVCTRIRNPQVQHRYRRPKTLSSVGVRYKAFQQCLCEFPHSQRAHSVQERTKHINDQRKKHLVPRSHTIPGPVLSVQRTEITAFSEDYQQPAAPEKLRSVTAYLRVVYCVPGSNQAVSNPHPSSLQTHVTKGQCLTYKEINWYL